MGTQGIICLAFAGSLSFGCGSFGGENEPEKHGVSSKHQEIRPSSANHSAGSFSSGFKKKSSKSLKKGHFTGGLFGKGHPSKGHPGKGHPSKGHPGKGPWHWCQDRPDMEEPEALCAWQPYSEGLTSGRVHTVYWDPRVEGRAYASSARTIYVSHDAGTTWSVQGMAPGHVNQIRVDWTKPGALLAATSEGIAHSEDAGMTWSLSISAIGMRSVMSHPAQPLLMMSSASNGGLFRSLDGGVTWGTVGLNMSFASFFHIYGDPDDAQMILMGGGAIEPGAPGLIVRSEDGGVTFSTIRDDIRQVRYFSVCPSDKNIMWASTYSQALVSTNGGLDWADSGLGVLQPYDATVGGVGCQQVVVEDWNRGTWRSEDGGASWIDSPQVVGPERRSGGVATSPDESAIVLSATYAGVSRSDDGGASWTLVQGTGQPSLRSISRDPNDMSRLFVSAFIQGTWERRKGDSLPWKKLTALGLDEYYHENMNLSSTDPNVSIVGMWGPVLRSDAGLGGPYVELEPRFTNPQAVAMGESGVAFIATQVRGVVRSYPGLLDLEDFNEGLPSWQTQAGLFNDVRTIHWLDSGRLVIGTYGRGIYRRDPGEDWVRTYVQDEKVTCMVRAGNDFYACSAENGVLVSHDDGESWDSSLQGLAALPIVDLATDPMTDDVFAATSRGVYAAQDESWALIDGGCVEGITDIEVVTSYGTSSLVGLTSQGKILSLDL